MTTGYERFLEPIVLGWFVKHVRRCYGETFLRQWTQIWCFWKS